MTVCLVAMPWQSLETPSLPIALLRSAAVNAGLAPPLAYHANLRWAEFLLERTGGEMGPPEYTLVAEEGLFDGFGDWVFTGVLHDDPDFGVRTMTDYAIDGGYDITAITRMRAHAEEFIDLAVAEILALRPTIVGFSSTFMQNVPSLAAAKRLKRLAPDVTIVLGGGNCDGPMGAALHRNYPFVDYVIRGEAEESFPRLLTALAGAGPLAEVPGLCWRDAEGTQQLNAAPAPLPASRFLTPDFDDWYARIEDSPVNGYIEPKLIMETARGCWWGEKHHCTFCGLNGTLMQFRAKAADVVIAELTEQVSRYRVLDVIMVDNIIANEHITEVLPRIAALGWDLRVHYEVKSNLKPEEIELFRAAGVAHVQPGIESLVSPVLKIMDKGVTAVRNLRTLRDCESAGLTTTWNWLYGFPGESYADYVDVLRQVPALVHLQPPSSVSRIMLERFSPYFNNPALGFPERATARPYRHVYALDEAEMHDMVYLFDTPPQGLSDVDAKGIRDLVRQWTARYGDSTLVRADRDGAIVLVDRRVGWPEADHRITEPWARAAYLELEHGRSVSALRRNLAEAGFTVGDEELRQWLAGLAERGLVFTERGQWLSLATTSIPIKVV
jgi:ribosomal peptide maturation radical SAM protein 1